MVAASRMPSSSAMARSTTFSCRALSSINSRRFEPGGLSSRSCLASSPIWIGLSPSTARGCPSGAMTTSCSSNSGVVNNSSCWRGVFMTVKSRSPCSRSGIRAVVVESITVVTTSGKLRLSSSNRGGKSQRPVVPMIPIRTWPLTLDVMDVTSSRRAASSVFILRARVSTAWPSGVSSPALLSTRIAPRSSSRRAM